MPIGGHVGRGGVYVVVRVVSVLGFELILGNSCQGGDCCVCDMNFDGRHVGFALWISVGCFGRVWYVYYIF